MVKRKNIVFNRLKNTMSAYLNGHLYETVPTNKGKYVLSFDLFYELCGELSHKGNNHLIHALTNELLKPSCFKD